MTDRALTLHHDLLLAAHSGQDGGSTTDRALSLVAIVGLAIAVAGLGFLIRERRLSRRQVLLLALTCAVLLVFQLATDWPFPVHFWHDHDVVSSVWTTVLLLGIGVLAYEDRELRAQQRLDSSLTAAGVGGMVSHLIDVDVALGLVCSREDPAANGWEGYDAPVRPLRWVHKHRDRLARTAGPNHDDPRTWAAVLPGAGPAQWRETLVDQCIRRLLAGIRDWSVLINTSRNGTRVLIAIAELRKDLMELAGLLRDATSDPLPLLISLRQRARLLSAFLEQLSGAEPPRPEVLLTFDPVQPVGELEWAADHKGRDLFQAEWRTTLAETERQLRRTAVSEE